jgi:hypothetical protein
LSLGGLNVSLNLFRMNGWGYSLGLCVYLNKII